MTTKKIPTTSSPLANIAHGTGKDTAPTYDEMTGLSSEPSVPATIFKYTYYGITEEVVVDTTKYGNGNLALVLLGVHSKQIVTIASINIPKITLEEGEIVVKDHSENEGMAQWLEDNKIAEHTGKCVHMPYGNICPIMKLL